MLAWIGPSGPLCFDCAADLTEAEQHDARWRGTVCTECADAALALVDELRGGLTPDTAKRPSPLP